MEILGSTAQTIVASSVDELIVLLADARRVALPSSNPLYAAALAAGLPTVLDPLPDQWPFLGSEIHPDTGNDVGAALAALVAANPGRQIKLRRGTYIIDLSGVGAGLFLIDLLDGTEIIGEPGAVLMLRGTSGTKVLFRCFNDNMTVDKLKIVVDSANAGTTIFIIFQPGGGGKNLTIGAGIEVDGSKTGVAAWQVHVVSPSSTTNFTGIWFEGEWHHCNRAWLKANTDTGEQNELRFTNRLYLHDMYADPIALNTPSGRVYDVVMEHTSRDVLTAAMAHVAIGSSEDVRCSAKIYGSGKRGLHLEEGVRRARIIGAHVELTDADAIGMLVADNNIHLATEPTDIIVALCTFRGPGKASAGSVGWQFANDATIRGPINGFIGADNIIEDWEKAVLGDDLMIGQTIHDNNVRRCGTGFNIALTANQAATQVKSRINSNFMEDVTIPFDSGSGSEAFWGSGNRAGFQEFMGATLWATGTAYKKGDRVSNAGLKYEANVKHTAGATFAGDAANWTLIDRWTNGLGSSPGSIVHNTALCRLTTGANAAGTYATNGVQRAVTDRILKPSLAPIRIGARIKVDNITSVALTFGLTDDATTFEETIAVNSGTTQVNAAADAVAFHFQTGVTVTNWQGLGVKAGVSATKVDTGIAPVAATNQFLEIAVDALGNATLYIDGAAVGTIANAVSPTALLTAFINAKARGTSPRLADYESCHVGWGA